MVVAAAPASATWVTKTIWLEGEDPQAKRAEIRQYFVQTWALTESLFALIKNTDAFYVRHEPLRHPLIFYYGHPAVFYINKLVSGRFGVSRLDPGLESMLAVGVDEMSWDDLDPSHYDWPSLDVLRRYRHHAFRVIESLIDCMPLELPITQQSAAWAVLMGIEHERIHIETSSVIMREMPLDDLVPPPAQGPWVACRDSGASPELEWLVMPGGSVHLGKSERDRTYGWDNEFGAEQHDVQSFEVSHRLVTNEDFLAFVEAGGYSDQRWWSDEGWRWRRWKDACCPHFWRPSSSGFCLRLLLEERPLPLNWPVEVNALEAAAYCSWLSDQIGRSVELPTELQARYLRQQLSADQPDWAEAPGNINLEGFGSPCPVDLYQHGDLYDLIGNVWQWSQTPIRPLSGFQVHPLYDDFSIPTFDGQHNLMFGGSWISTGDFALSSVRYAVRRHFFQHAGFRLVINSSSRGDVPGSCIYESEPSVCQYLDFHYGSEHFGVSNFPKACVDALLPFLESVPRVKALDVGCSVGRSSFELARHFQRVDAIDFSVRFIQSALKLSQGQSLDYTLVDHGELRTQATASLAPYGLLPFAERVAFLQADACNLRSAYSGYNLVFAANVLDRLYAPREFLAQLNGCVLQGGLLVLTSPYTWLEEFTPKDQWLGARCFEGRPLTSFDALRECLAGWELIERFDLPFVLRETSRKYQHSLADYTIWRRVC